MKDEEFLRSMRIRPDEIPEFSTEPLGEFRYEVEYFAGDNGEAMAAMPARLFQAMRFTNESLGQKAQKQRNDPSWKALALAGWITAGALAVLVVQMAGKGWLLR